ncbi:MAG: DUF3124 domain-containing protein [Chloroflexota bacterium]
MMRSKLFGVLGLGVLAMMGLAACATPPPSGALSSGAQRPVTGRDLRIVTGQTVYVPAYSEVFLGRENLSTELAVTLAVHNTDLDAPIIIESVGYYDTDGNLVTDYIDGDPVELSPLATTGYVVPEGEGSGGWGSNFVVIWGAEEPVHEPVIEAFMVSTTGLSGISAISIGRVISQTGAGEVASGE